MINVDWDESGFTVLEKPLVSPNTKTKTVRPYSGAQNRNCHSRVDSGQPHVPSRCLKLSFQLHKRDLVVHECLWVSLGLDAWLETDMIENGDP